MCVVWFRLITSFISSTPELFCLCNLCFFLPFSCPISVFSFSCSLNVFCLTFLCFSCAPELFCLYFCIWYSLKLFCLFSLCFLYILYSFLGSVSRALFSCSLSVFLEYYLAVQSLCFFQCRVHVPGRHFPFSLS